MAVRRLTEGDGIEITEEVTAQRLRLAVRREVVAFVADLLDNTDGEKGAGSLAFSPALPYPEWSIGYALQSVMTGVGTGTPWSTIAALIEALTGKIGVNQLTEALGERIKMIDAPDTAMGSVNARLKAEMDARVAALATEAGYRASGDEATLDGAKAYTQGWSYSKAAADGALQALGNSLGTAFAAGDSGTLASAQSYVGGYAYSKAATDGAIAASANSLTTAFSNSDAATLTSAKSYVESYAYSKSAADGAIAASASSLATAFSNADASTLGQAQSFTYSRSVIDGAFVATSNSLTSAFNAADAATLANAQSYVGSYAYSKAATDGAIASATSSLTAAFNSGNAATLAAAQAYTYSRATIDSAIAGSVDTIAAGVVGGLQAAIQTEAQTRASQTGELYAQWTVKLDVNGYVSGFGLASTARDSAPASAFIVRADSFSIASPSGPGITPATPFVVRTTPTVIDGVNMPAGVYIDTAFIGYLSGVKLTFESIVTKHLTAGSVSIGAVTTFDPAVADAPTGLVVGPGFVRYLVLVTASYRSYGYGARRIDFGPLDPRAFAYLLGGSEMSVARTVVLQRVVDGAVVDLCVLGSGAGYVNVASGTVFDSVAVTGLGWEKVVQYRLALRIAAGSTSGSGTYDLDMGIDANATPGRRFLSVSEWQR